MKLQFISLIGFFVFITIAWLLSSNRRQVRWKTIGWGIGLQLVIGAVVFRAPFSQRIFLWINDAAVGLLNVSKSGSSFLFGPLAAAPGEQGSVGFVLVFQVLPVAIFFSAFTAALYHLHILQFIVRLFAKIFHKTMGTSGAESLCGAANIFVGIESALVIRPYLDKMTRSELLTVLATGMGTVASTTLGVYIGFLNREFPQIAGHLISASVISIPAIIVIVKLLLPEAEKPETESSIPPDNPETRSANLMSAIITGAMDGLKLAAGICALLIAMLGLVSLVDKLLEPLGRWMNLAEPLSLVKILSWVFYPFAALLGIAKADIYEASVLLGKRVILTEVVSYQGLAQMISSGQISDPRTVIVISYALCGFAHIASTAIFVGGTAALAPSRRDDLAALGFRALLAATLATLMTGCVAGIFA